MNSCLPCSGHFNTLPLMLHFHCRYPVCMHSDSPKLAVKFGVDNWVYPLCSVSISGFNFVASLPTATNTSSQSGRGSACGLLLLCGLRSCPLAEGLPLNFFSCFSTHPCLRSQLILCRFYNCCLGVGICLLPTLCWPKVLSSVPQAASGIQDSSSCW